MSLTIAFRALATASSGPSTTRSQSDLKDGMTAIDLANYVSSPEDSTMERQGSSST